MHITYENEQCEVLVVDDNIQKLIDQKANNRDLIEATIKSTNEIIDQLKTEQSELIEISAKFAQFTQNNAISVFNDDLDAYLDLLIREEEGKKQFGAKNDSVLKGIFKNIMLTWHGWFLTLFFKFRAKGRQTELYFAEKYF